MSDDEFNHEHGDNEVITNQPHDEEVALTDEDETDSSAQPSPMANPVVMQHHEEEEEEDEEDEEDDPPHHEVVHQEEEDVRQPTPVSMAKIGAKGDETSDDEEDKGGDAVLAGYSSKDYDHLQVSDEVRELFQYIDRYQPQSIQLESRLKPFIPDYIPAIGDIDEFIKVARPDGKPDDLGLKVLDEPAAKQSDPTVLNLQLRAISKKANLKPVEVASIEGAEHDPRKIANWIASVQDLHKDQVRGATVMYSKNMPDIEQLMQEWPPEVEEMMQHLKLPDETLDLDIAQYCKTMCAILDIPVYTNVVESLHVMFTLYLEFKNNPFLAGKKEEEPSNAPNVFTIEE